MTQIPAKVLTVDLRRTDPPHSLSVVAAVHRTGRRRMRVALLLTGVLLTVYGGFMLLVAIGKALLAQQLVDGLSLALLLAAFVIVAAWFLAWTYVIWANKHHDPACDALNRGEQP